MVLNQLKHLQHQLWCCWTAINQVCLWREQAGLPYLVTLSCGREEGETLWMLWKCLHCCPTCQCSSFFTLVTEDEWTDTRAPELSTLLFFGGGACWGLKSEILLVLHGPWADNSSQGRQYWSMGGQACPARPVPQLWCFLYLKIQFLSVSI